MGRKSTYTPEIADEICERLAAGETLRMIAATEGMPAPSTVVDWTRTDEQFSARYASARKDGLDAIAEQMVEIADNEDEDANSRRVRVDTRKWLLSKLRPDKYGDRTTLAGDPAAPLQARVVVEHVNPPGVAQIDKARFKVGPPSEK
jgi:hypothetical protein